MAAARHSILFVCLGNICRSPMAEGLFRHRVSGLAAAESFRIDSAGTGAWHVGQPPDPRARAALAAHGIDISMLRGRQVAREDFETFDLVLAMDEDNLRTLRNLAPDGLEDKVALFLDHAPGLGAREVPDPYYGGEDGFEEAIRLIDAAAEGLLAGLLAQR